jgi:hypothetical protein
VSDQLPEKMETDEGAEKPEEEAKEGEKGAGETSSSHLLPIICLFLIYCLSVNLV